MKMVPIIFIRHPARRFPDYIVEPTSQERRRSIGPYRVRQVWGSNKYFKAENKIIKHGIESIGEAMDYATAMRVADRLDPPEFQVDPPF